MKRIKSGWIWSSASLCPWLQRAQERGVCQSGAAQHQADRSKCFQVLVFPKSLFPLICTIFPPQTSPQPRPDIPPESANRRPLQDYRQGKQRHQLRPLSNRVQRGTDPARAWPGLRHPGSPVRTCLQCSGAWHRRLVRCFHARGHPVAHPVQGGYEQVNNLVTSQDVEF